MRPDVPDSWRTSCNDQPYVDMSMGSDKHYSWRREMQGTPLSLISPLGQELFRLSPDLPSLQPLAIAHFLLAKFPDYVTGSIAARPLTVHIDIYIDIEAAGDMHCHIGSRD